MKTDDLPLECHRYFWDIDIKTLSLTRNATFIIERLLEYGNERANKWVLHQYSKREIYNVIINSRRLSARSANFWAYVFEIPVEEILCLSKSFRNTYRSIWKH